MAAMMADLGQYFRSFIPPRDELLQELEGEASAEKIPIVGPVVGELLFILARATGAQAILELGAALALSREVILICRKGSVLPDAIRHLDRIEYEQPSDLTERLRKKIRI